MFTMTRILFAAACFFIAQAAIADPRSAPIDASGRAERVGAKQAAHRQVLNPALTPKAGNAVNVSTPGLPRANAVRAYPPSCLADPLPDQTLGPTYSKSVNLAAFDRNSGQFVSEGVTIIVWRVACSSSTFFTSATLMRIQRQSQFEGDAVIYPLFPALQAKQGNIVFSDDPNYVLNLIRSPTEPNTVISDTLTDTPIIFSTTFVLENYDSSAAGFFDFNLAFGLRFDNLLTGGASDLYFLDVPTYSPNSGTYPAAFQNLPISGYMTSNFYDPAASGEGLAMQIFEPVGDAQNLIVSFTWVAYDPAGIPFWLSGQATIVRGAKSASATMFYRTDGGLGGNSGAASAPIIWGTATVSFPDCNTMTLTYASNPGLPAGIPTGNGTRTWLRLANVNALACE
ncbi:MAG: hypothetical protein KA372_08790 [Dokdonella sp.]|jgi:hypothetical protein|uniref:hypothetical protein n=1 Tax=Dokdonella sp. TaxID=2291710 RepID=UPI001B7B71DE|nr:hypothetical protein [Dokdonella sp.]MBP6327247.1 hypothetical protein [Dokdonella sp.]MBP6330154.1 hypothetical protein [Dokdonella sp.]